MWEVVNGDGTAGAQPAAAPRHRDGGKTGTAQVRRIAGASAARAGDWKYRDHGLFVFFAPFDKPRYAGAVVIEHGLGGARAAAPVAKDVLTFCSTGQGAGARWPRSSSNGAARWPSAMARARRGAGSTGRRRAAARRGCRA